MRQRPRRAGAAHAVVAVAVCMALIGGCGSAPTANDDRPPPTDGGNSGERNYAVGSWEILGGKPRPEIARGVISTRFDALNSSSEDQTPNRLVVTVGDQQTGPTVRHRCEVHADYTIELDPMPDKNHQDWVIPGLVVPIHCDGTLTAAQMSVDTGVVTIRDLATDGPGSQT